MFANMSKDDTYSNLKVNTRGGTTVIKGNSSFFAVPWDVSGGALAILPLSKKGRLKEIPPLIRVRAKLSRRL